MQSKGFSKIILDLNLWPGVSLPAEKVTVGLSRYAHMLNVVILSTYLDFFRVEGIDDIRLLPQPPNQDFQHLYQLKSNPSMLAWFAGFKANGFWDSDLSKAALKSNPIPQGKQKLPKQNDKRPFKPKTRTDDFKAAKTTGRKSTTGRRQKGFASSDDENSDGIQTQTVASSQSESQSRRAVARFSLNRSQVLPSDADNIYSSFFVRGDGDCLFTSFSQSLQLQTTNSQLRRRVVDFITAIPDSMIRISTLNCHIAREQDAHNKAWRDIAFFDAGTVFQPGVMDARFHRLWAQYSTEMLSGSWAGEQEIIALAELHQVNAVVWELRGGYAEVSFSHFLAQSGANRTVHLRLVGKKHYEYTDIDEHFVPNAAPAFEYRSSSRPRRPRNPSP